MRLLNSLQPFALLLLRLSFALIFIAHGYPGIAHRPNAMQAIFLQHGFPGYFAYVSGVLELFGGGLLLLGLFTRGAALLLALEMLFLMWRIYPPQSYFLVNEYQFPLVMVTGCFALAALGPGPFSLDYPLLERTRAPRNSRNQ